MLSLNQPIKLIELASAIGANLHLPSGHLDANIEQKNHDLMNQQVSSVESIDLATKGQVTFLANPLYVKYLSSTEADAIIIEPKYLAKCKLAALVTSNPKLAFAKLLKLCGNSTTPTGIHPSCVIGKEVIIGKNVNIEAGVVIGDYCSIGDRTTIRANVVLYDKVKIGQDCSIHSNTVIGSDGFGYAQDADNIWVKIPHFGGVVIEDQVEIGSNTSIDRGCIGDTLIKKGVIIDNLVQIAHNVVVGEYTAIAGCVAIAGSTVIGNRCLIGGASAIAGHLVIVDNVYITGTSSINKSLSKPGVYSSGFPAKDNNTWKKNIVRFNSLDRSFKEIFDKIKHLEEKIK